MRMKFSVHTGEGIVRKNRLKFVDVSIEIIRIRHDDGVHYAISAQQFYCVIHTNPFSVRSLVPHSSRFV